MTTYEYLWRAYRWHRARGIGPIMSFRWAISSYRTAQAYKRMFRS